jgi:hypothetical protein
MNKMRQAVQMLLSYWVWLKRNWYWKQGNKNAKESAESASKGDMMAVMSTCDFSHTRKLVFSTEWQQSYVYHARNCKTPSIQLVEVNAIVRHCLMVPHDSIQTSNHENQCKELWGNEFNDYSQPSTIYILSTCIHVTRIYIYNN